MSPVFSDTMNESLPKFSSPLPLVGQPQRYVWGKVGQASRIAPFISGVVPEEPLAEYWLGCHPKAPSEVNLPNGGRCLISDVLPDADALPFMLKVLSINPDFGLSIQSHPDQELARQLHARDPANYPDPFHKPEVGVALSEVKLLFDIKSAADLCGIARIYPELMELLSAETSSFLSQNVQQDLSISRRMRRGFFVDCITAEPSKVSAVMTRILNRAGSSPAQETREEISIVRRLSQTHGLGDPGLAVSLVMNLLTLSPGEAIFIGPNVPHAYLDGDLVECMACSDNVIRAGLTSKFRDVATLVETTDYSYSGPPSKAALSPVCPGYDEFSLQLSEFSLGRVSPGSTRVPIETEGGFLIVFCVGGDATLSNSINGDRMSLNDGGAVLFPKGVRGWSVSAGTAQVFVARANKR